MTGRNRLLIAMPDRPFDEFVGDAGVAALRPFFDPIEHVNPAGLTTSEWADFVLDFASHAMLTGWDTPAIPLTAMPTLKVVAHTAGTVRELVRRDMIERGLLVTNWGDIAAASVAEHALLLILTALRRMTQTTFDLHLNHGWQTACTTNAAGLFGRRVGIHGFGAIARTLVRLLRPFDCSITAYSDGVPDELFAEFGVSRAESLEALFAGAEVLVEVEALTPQTRGIVTKKLFDRLPDGGVFVNVGRGATVDGAALYAVAESGRLQIALDVFEEEPLPAASPLRGLGNVTLTPHVGGPTVDRRRVCGRRAIENLKRFARGEPLVGLITPEIYDRST